MAFLITVSIGFEHRQVIETEYIAWLRKVSCFSSRVCKFIARPSQDSQKLHARVRMHCNSVAKINWKIIAHGLVLTSHAGNCYWCVVTQRPHCPFSSRLSQRKAMQRSAWLQWYLPSRQPSSNSSWFLPISIHCWDHRHTSTWLIQMARWPGELKARWQDNKAREQESGIWNLMLQPIRPWQWWASGQKIDREREGGGRKSVV